MVVLLQPAKSHRIPNITGDTESGNNRHYRPYCHTVFIQCSVWLREPDIVTHGDAGPTTIFNNYVFIPSN